MGLGLGLGLGLGQTHVGLQPGHVRLQPRLQIDSNGWSASGVPWLGLGLGLGLERVGRAVRADLLPPICAAHALEP